MTRQKAFITAAAAVTAMSLAATEANANLGSFEASGSHSPSQPDA